MNVMDTLLTFYNHALNREMYRKCVLLSMVKKQRVVQE